MSNEAILTGIVCVASGPVGVGKVRAETWTSSASQHSRHGRSHPRGRRCVASENEASFADGKSVQLRHRAPVRLARRCEDSPFRSRAAIADVVAEERLLDGLLPRRSRDWGAGVCYPKREDTVFCPAPTRTGGGICYRGVCLTPVAHRLGTRSFGWRFINPS